MKVSIEIVNKSKKRIEKKILTKIAEKTVSLISPRADRIQLSLVFVEKDKIRRLNKEYRQINKPTDILSFLYNSGYNRKKGQNKARHLEGELIICPAVIIEDAKRDGLSFKEELAYVLSHGFLHLLGKKHGKKMFGLQDKVVGSLKNKI
jgi:probable rRNA maturation factor